MSLTSVVAFVGEVLHAMTNRPKFNGPILALYSEHQIMMNNNDAKMTDGTKPNLLDQVAKVCVDATKPLIEFTFKHVIYPAINSVVDSVATLMNGSDLGISSVADYEALVMATGSELSSPVSNTLVSVGVRSLEVPHLEQSIYISTAFITFIGCVIIVLALSCDVIQKNEAVILLAILQCFSLYSNGFPRFASAIESIIGWFVRVSSFDSMNETTQVMQTIASSEATTEELSVRNTSASSMDNQRSDMTLVDSSSTAGPMEKSLCIVEFKYIAVAYAHKFLVDLLHEIVRSDSKSIQSLALPIAKKDAVQTLATSELEMHPSAINLWETCLIVFVWMVATPLIGTFVVIMLVAVTANWSSVFQTLPSIGAVTMLCTCIKHASINDSVTVHEPQCDAIQGPSHELPTNVVCVGACSDDSNHTMKKFDMLVCIDESEPPDTENGHTDLYETFFVALFWMFLVLLSTFAAVMMTLLIVTSDYFCPKTVLQAFLMSCAHFAITSGVTSSMFRQCISFHIDWVEMKLYDLFNSVGLPLAGDISRLFDFISRRLRVRRVQFNQEDTVHVIHRYTSDISWALDKTAALNYFQRRRIRLFIQGWEIERQIGLLPPNLCASLDRMLKWYDVDEIDFFLREYETLDTIKEARRLHTQQFCLVLDELLTTTTASAPVDAKSKSFLGNVHVDEPIGATRDSLSSITSKSEHSTHPTNVVSELIQSWLSVSIWMLFAPLVGVSTVMISLVLMSIAANCGCILVIQAMLLATSSVYIVISAIMILLGTIHGIHFNAVRDMGVTSIASITSYGSSCINHLLCCIWHSIAGQFMIFRYKPMRFVGYFQLHFFIALEYTLSGLRCIRMRIKLISFVASCRANFSDIRSLTSYVWSCIILLPSVVQRTWHCILGQFTRAKVKIMGNAAHTPESSMIKRYRTSTSAAINGQSKAYHISGSRRSRKKRQYDQRIAKRSRPSHTSSAFVDKLTMLISNAFKILLKLCANVTLSINTIVGRAVARFHSAVIITCKCIIFTYIVGNATLNTVGLHRGVFQAALIMSNGVLAHQTMLPAASIHFHEQHIDGGLTSCEYYNTGYLPCPLAWHLVNATPFPKEKFPSYFLVCIVMKQK